MMSVYKRPGHLIVQDSGATRTWRAASIWLGLVEVGQADRDRKSVAITVKPVPVELMQLVIPPIIVLQLADGIIPGKSVLKDEEAFHLVVPVSQNVLTRVKDLVRAEVFMNDSAIDVQYESSIE